jgi:mannose-6-phosphate isomerase-like protein (cupin superfamily)
MGPERRSRRGEVAETDAAGIRRLAESEVVQNWRGAVDFWTLLAPGRANGTSLYFEALHGDLAPHRHPDYDEVYVVESGAGVVELDGVRHAVGARDVVWVPRGAAHAVRPGPGGLRLWAFAHGAGSAPVWLERAAAGP